MTTPRRWVPLGGTEASPAAQAPADEYERFVKENREPAPASAAPDAPAPRTKLSLGQRVASAIESAMQPFGEAMAPANEAAMRALGSAPAQPQQEAAAQPDQKASSGSVLEGARVKPIGSTSPSLAPVDQKMREQFNAAWDAATPEERTALSKRNGWVGQLAREREGLFSNPDAVMTETGDRFDPRVEKRTQRLVSAGEDPRFARTAAQAAARAGVAPGKELSAVDTIQESKFDYLTICMKVL